MSKFVAFLSLAVVVALTASCAGALKNLGKSEVDMVIDAVIAENTEHISNLAVHLYSLNPEELTKTTPPVSLAERLTQIVEHPTDTAYAELENTTAVNTLRLFFNKDFNGDRVFALLIGIHSMLRFSYNNQTEFFMFDDMDPQALYNSARNLETVLERLYLEDEQGHVLLNVATLTPGNTFHNSMIKLISNQDLLAKITSQQTHRTINRIIHGTVGVMIPN